MIDSSCVLVEHLGLQLQAAYTETCTHFLEVIQLLIHVFALLLVKGLVCIWGVAQHQGLHVKACGKECNPVSKGLQTAAGNRCCLRCCFAMSQVPVPALYIHQKGQWCKHVKVTGPSTAPSC